VAAEAAVRQSRPARRRATTVPSTSQAARPPPAPARNAPTAAATDWSQILALYDQLLALAPGPVVALHRAVAVAEIEGPEAALAIVDRLELPRYPLYHAIRADLLSRVSRRSEAALAYRAAIEATHNAAEHDFLERQLQALNQSWTPAPQDGAHELRDELGE